jgi:hypothetical protein
MKLTDMIISSIIKKGILYEARNCDFDFTIPATSVLINGDTQENYIMVKVKVEHMSLRIERE